MSVTTETGYDDIVTFGRVLGRLWEYDDEAVSQLLDYLEKWLELGGTLDDECLDAFENWYDNRGIVAAENE